MTQERCCRHQQDTTFNLLRCSNSVQILYLFTTVRKDHTCSILLVFEPLYSFLILRGAHFIQYLLSFVLFFFPRLPFPLSSPFPFPASLSMAPRRNCQHPERKFHSVHMSQCLIRSLGRLRRESYSAVVRL